MPTLHAQPGASTGTSLSLKLDAAPPDTAGWLVLSPVPIAVGGALPPVAWLRPFVTDDTGSALLEVPLPVGPRELGPLVLQAWMRTGSGALAGNALQYQP